MDEPPAPSQQSTPDQDTNTAPASGSSSQSPSAQETASSNPPVDTSIGSGGLESTGPAGALGFGPANTPPLPGDTLPSIQEPPIPSEHSAVLPTPVAPASPGDVASFQQPPDLPEPQPDLSAAAAPASQPPAGPTESSTIPPPPPPPPMSPVPPVGGSTETHHRSRKKVFLIAFLILLIASVLVGVLLMMRGSTGREEAVETAPVEETETPPVAQPLTLSVSSPTEGDVVATIEAVVSGKTAPDTTVIFFTDADANAATSDDTGSFSGKVKLASGINELSVSVLSEGTEEKKVSRVIVFDSSLTASAVKAITGLAQQVTDKLVSIRTKVGGIIDVAIDSSTRIVGNDTKPLTTRAISVGDILAAIPAESSSSATATASAKAQKVAKLFVKESSPSAATAKQELLFGTITGINGSEITLLKKATSTEQFITLTIAGESLIKVDGSTATVKSLQLGQVVGVVGTLTETEMEVILLAVVSQPQ